MYYMSAAGDLRRVAHHVRDPEGGRLVSRSGYSWWKIQSMAIRFSTLLASCISIDVLVWIYVNPDPDY